MKLQVLAEHDRTYLNSYEVLRLEEVDVWSSRKRAQMPRMG